MASHLCNDGSEPTEQQFEPPDGQRPTQFGLKMIFAAVTVAGLVCGAIHWIGLLATIVVLFIGGMTVAAYALPRAPWPKIKLALSGFLFSSIAVLLVLPAMQPPTCTATRRSQCNYNLKLIALGLQVYADVYHCFPPAYIADAHGRPMHSWRMLILPYIEQKPLYDKYDFNEPWNGPHNRLLAGQMPACYHCESDGPGRAATTSYVAITGPQTIWPGVGCAGFASIKDGASATLALVEVGGWNIPWMEPRDLPFAALARGVNPPVGIGISSRHAEGAHAAFCDGHTVLLPDDMPIAELQALATKAGGEALSRDY